MVPLLSAAIGWCLRHFNVIAPADSTPQTRPQGGGVVSPPAVPADLPSMIGSIVSEEVRKGVVYLEGRLLPGQPARAVPQTTPDA
jgi:hypothetical protein